MARRKAVKKEKAKVALQVVETVKEEEPKTEKPKNGNDKKVGAKKEAKPTNGTSKNTEVPIDKFEALKKKIEARKDDVTAVAVDAMFLEGGKLEDIFNKAKNFASKKGRKDFTTGGVKKIEGHISKRKGSGWIFERNNDQVKLVGCKL